MLERIFQGASLLICIFVRFMQMVETYVHTYVHEEEGGICQTEDDTKRGFSQHRAVCSVPESRSAFLTDIKCLPLVGVEDEEQLDTKPVFDSTAAGLWSRYVARCSQDPKK